MSHGLLDMTTWGANALRIKEKKGKWRCFCGYVARYARVVMVEWNLWCGLVALWLCVILVEDHDGVLRFVEKIREIMVLSDA